MDNKKLADLLFPNAAAISELQKKYPPRALKQGARVLRVAPSPTGFLHLGTFFSALCQYIEAKKTGGVFYLRLEDTDQKREVENAGNVLVEMLNFFGVTPDEGYRGDGKDEVGAYGPYVQSHRLDIYKAFAHRLIERGRAFACFCEKTQSKDDVLEKREQSLADDGKIEEKDACRELTFEQIETNIKAGKKFAIRLKSEGNSEKTMKIVDLFKGERELRENEKDIVLLKSDGMPTYALGHLADDLLMGTTVVVRGEEWYASLPSHIELFLACGFKPIKYGHAPLICLIDEETGNKRKFSKRKDPRADMRFYKEQGYPKEALWEYVLTLANSKFEDWRRANPRANIIDFDFKLAGLGSNNPLFDGNKLDDISKNVIAKFDARELFDRVLAWGKEYDSEFFAYLQKNKAHATKVFSIDRTAEKSRKDIAKFSEVKNMFDYMWGSDFAMEEEAADKKVLESYAANADYSSKENWFVKLKNLAGNLGYAADMKEYKANPDSFKGSITDVVTNLRLAITGRKNSPDLFSICECLGEEEVKNRLQKAMHR